MPLHVPLKRPLFKVFPDHLLSAHAERLDAVGPQTAQKIVDRGVGMRGDEDGMRDLPVLFEELDGFDDDARLARSGGLPN